MLLTLHCIFGDAKSSRITSEPGAECQDFSRQTCAERYLGFPWRFLVLVAVPVVGAVSPY